MTARWFTLALVCAAGAGTMANGRADVYTILSGHERAQTFVGTWHGRYVVTSCEESGAYAEAGFCEGELNSVLPMSISLRQEEAALTGELSLGRIRFTTLGSPVDERGLATFTASSLGTASSIQTTLYLTSPHDARIIGRMTQVWRTAGQPGEARLDAQIVDSLGRGLSSPLPSLPVGGQDGMLQDPELARR